MVCRPDFAVATDPKLLRRSCYWRGRKDSLAAPLLAASLAGVAGRQIEAWPAQLQPAVHQLANLCQMDSSRASSCFGYPAQSLAIHAIAATLTAIAASYYSTAASAVASFALNWFRREAAGRKVAAILGVAAHGIVGDTDASAAFASVAIVRLTIARSAAVGRTDPLKLLESAVVPSLEAPA